MLPAQTLMAVSSVHVHLVILGMVYFQEMAAKVMVQAHACTSNNSMIYTVAAQIQTAPKSSGLLIPLIVVSILLLVAACTIILLIIIVIK